MSTTKTSITAALVVALSAVALVGCKKGPGGSCHANKECKDNLVCLAPADAANACAELEQAKTTCKGSKACAFAGDCSLTSTVAADDIVQCLPGSDADCQQSTVCKTKGMCHLNPASHSCTSN